jgi:hypothetical protein
MQYHITNLNGEINDLGRVINQANLLSKRIMNKRVFFHLFKKFMMNKKNLVILGASLLPVLARAEETAAAVGGASSSATVYGISKLSTAPANANFPIAVGNNDVRVEHYIGAYGSVVGTSWLLRQMSSGGYPRCGRHCGPVRKGRHP